MKKIISLILIILPLSTFADAEKRLKPEFNAQVENPDAVAVEEYTPIDLDKSEDKGNLLDGQLKLESSEVIKAESSPEKTIESKPSNDELKNLIIDDAPVKAAPKTEEGQNVNLAEIKNILRSNLPKFSACYQKELNRQKDPGKISGVINFKIHLKSNGSVKRTEIYFTGKKTPKMNNCMFDVINKIKFPAFKNKSGTLEINQTIKLHPKKI